MRKENGIIVFETLEEEEKFIAEFTGIFITNRPVAIGSCSVINVVSGKKEEIGYIDSYYIYGGNRGGQLRDEVNKFLDEKDVCKSLCTSGPEIAISTKINRFFNA